MRFLRGSPIIRPELDRGTQCFTSRFKDSKLLSELIPGSDAEENVSFAASTDLIIGTFTAQAAVILLRAASRLQLPPV